MNSTIKENTVTFSEIECKNLRITDFCENQQDDIILAYMNFMQYSKKSRLIKKEQFPFWYFSPDRNERYFTQKVGLVSGVWCVPTWDNRMLDNNRINKQARMDTPYYHFLRTATLKPFFDT